MPEEGITIPWSWVKTILPYGIAAVLGVGGSKAFESSDEKRILTLEMTVKSIEQEQDDIKRWLRALGNRVDLKLGSPTIVDP